MNRDHPRVFLRVKRSGQVFLLNVESQMKKPLLIAAVSVALAAGAILTGFYLWHRDLVANMIGHGPVDFVANVVPRFFS